MVYKLNLILNSDQDLVPFRKKQILRSNRNKNLQNQNSEGLFIQLLNAWLDSTNNSFPTPTSIEDLIE